MTEKIADRDVEFKSQKLKGEHFLFGVCGSIGAVESVKCIRELRRHSARVTPVMTSHAQEFITPLSLEWAADESVITNLTARAEHLEPYTGLVVCPATWNTMVDVSLGRASNALTTIAAIQIARVNPVLIVPTLNEEFTQHPLYRDVIETLGRFERVSIWSGPEEEGRMKMPSPESLAQRVIELINPLALNVH